MFKIKKNFIGCIIPAKSYSKRIPKKNLIKINDFCLLDYSIMIAEKISQTIFVSTDGMKLKKRSEKFGNYCPILRPKKFSKFLSNDKDYVFHYIDYLLDKKKELPEYLIQLRPTTPFRNIGLLKKAIKLIKSNKSASSLRSASIASHPPEKIFRSKGIFYTDFLDKRILNENSNLPSQYFKETYIPNGYIDILKMENLLKKKSLYGNKILKFITPEIIDIDTYDNLKLAQSISNIEKTIIIKDLKKRI